MGFDIHSVVTGAQPASFRTSGIIAGDTIYFGGVGSDGTIGISPVYRHRSFRPGTLDCRMGWLPALVPFLKRNNRQTNGQPSLGDFEWVVVALEHRPTPCYPACMKTSRSSRHLPHANMALAQPSQYRCQASITRTHRWALIRARYSSCQRGSKCGFTPQYTALRRLWKYRTGLVSRVPCNRLARKSRARRTISVRSPIKRHLPAV